MGLHMIDTFFSLFIGLSMVGGLVSMLWEWVKSPNPTGPVLVGILALWSACTAFTYHFLPKVFALVGVQLW
jgi:hypothetical protein